MEEGEEERYKDGIGRKRKMIKNRLLFTTWNYTTLKHTIIDSLAL